MPPAASAAADGAGCSFSGAVFFTGGAGRALVAGTFASGRVACESESAIALAGAAARAAGVFAGGGDAVRRGGCGRGLAAPAARFAGTGGVALGREEPGLGGGVAGRKGGDFDDGGSGSGSSSTNVSRSSWKVSRSSRKSLSSSAAVAGASWLLPADGFSFADAGFPDAAFGADGPPFSSSVRLTIAPLPQLHPTRCNRRFRQPRTPFLSRARSERPKPPPRSCLAGVFVRHLALSGRSAAPMIRCVDASWVPFSSPAPSALSSLVPATAWTCHRCRPDRCLTAGSQSGITSWRLRREAAGRRSLRRCRAPLPGPVSSRCCRALSLRACQRHPRRIASFCAAPRCAVRSVGR